MPTYKEIADALNCSKQHVYNLAREIDPDGAHIDSSGRTSQLDQWLASQVSAEVVRRRGPGRAAPTPPPASPAAASADSAGALVAEKDERISDLKARIDALEGEVVRLRGELEVSRECEGLHLPGHRKRVLARRAAALPEPAQGAPQAREAPPSPAPAEPAPAPEPAGPPAAQGDGRPRRPTFRESVDAAVEACSQGVTRGR